VTGRYLAVRKRKRRPACSSTASDLRLPSSLGSPRSGSPTQGCSGGPVSRSGQPSVLTSPELLSTRHKPNIPHRADRVPKADPSLSLATVRRWRTLLGPRRRAEGNGLTLGRTGAHLACFRNSAKAADLCVAEDCSSFETRLQFQSRVSQSICRPVLPADDRTARQLFSTIIGGWGSLREVAISRPIWAGARMLCETARRERSGCPINRWRRASRS
jgi:hypothetical protein